MNTLSKNLETVVNKLDMVLVDFCEMLKVVPAEITLSKLEGKADIILELRAAKALLKTTLTELNTVLTKGEEHLCIAIANDPRDIFNLDHPKAIITPMARGFYSISEAQLFYNWLPEKDIQQAFVGFANSKKLLANLCEGLRKDGQTLPPGVKEHTVANVRIRRK